MNGWNERGEKGYVGSSNIGVRRNPRVKVTTASAPTIENYRGTELQLGNHLSCFIFYSSSM